MDRKQHWDGVYSTKPVTTVSWFQERPEVSLRLIRSAAATSDSAIIDVGSGATRLIGELLAAGFRRLTVLDVSAAALDLARRRLGPRASAVCWVEGDATQAELTTAAFDVWHDRAAFHFLTEPGDRAAYLRLMSHAVKPGGHAILATFAPDGPTRCSGLPVVRYSPEELQHALGPAWTLVHEETEAHHTPSGAVQSFQYSSFRRQSDDHASELP